MTANTNPDQISQSEAAGRSVGLLVTFIAFHMAKNKGQFPSPPEIAKFADHCAGDDVQFRQETRDFFHGVIEAIAASLDPKPGEVL